MRLLVSIIMLTALLATAVVFGLCAWVDLGRVHTLESEPQPMSALEMITRREHEPLRVSLTDTPPYRLQCDSMVVHSPQTGTRTYLPITTLRDGEELSIVAEFDGQISCADLRKISGVLTYGQSRYFRLGGRTRASRVVYLCTDCTADEHLYRGLFLVFLTVLSIGGFVYVAFRRFTQKIPT